MAVMDAFNATERYSDTTEEPGTRSLQRIGIRLRAKTDLPLVVAGNLIAEITSSFPPLQTMNMSLFDKPSNWSGHAIAAAYAMAQVCPLRPAACPN